MTNSLIAQWLDSGEHQTEIDNVFSNIVRKSESAQSESETASIFEREIYFFLRNKLGFEIELKKETVVKGIVHSFSSKISSGRIDAIMNNLIIEYKHHSALRSDTEVFSAFRQVEEYITTLFKNNGIKHDAILTDGLKIAYFSFVGGDVRHTALKVMESSDVEVIIKAVLNNDTKKFEPINIVGILPFLPYLILYQRTSHQLYLIYS